jgi:hypothetical protein
MSREAAPQFDPIESPSDTHLEHEVRANKSAAIRAIAGFLAVVAAIGAVHEGKALLSDAMQHGASHSTGQQP